MGKLLTITEFANQACFSVSQIRRYINQGIISKIQPGGKGGKILIPETEFQNLLEHSENYETLKKEDKNLPGRTPNWKKHN